MSKEDLAEIISCHPRQRLSHLPTPLEEMPNLSRELKGVRLLIKRDDQTGIALGGNKARKLDFIVGDALRRKSDSIITWGGVQSNWCRQLAAAARRVGLDPVLILFRRAGLPADYDGNLLLDSILDANIQVIDWAPGTSFMELKMVAHLLNDAADKERAAGRCPYIAPIGGTFAEGSMLEPLGAISYAEALIEVLDQASARGFDINHIVVPSGSGSTQAGLLVAAKAVCPELKVIGISVCEEIETLTRFVRRVARETADALGLQFEILPEDVVVHGEFLGGGYGILDERSAAAMKRVGKTEGIILDPVYTSKAMGGLLELCQRGYFSPGSNVVFLHTGGVPAIFPYRQQIGELLAAPAALA